MGLKLGSLFDGIGSFPLAATMHGIEPVWASEIEKFPIAVTSKHFPQMKHLGDITKINGAEIEPVDIITAGSPCTDLSVAGKRAGLKGTQSSLFLHFIRIVREMRNATNNKFPRIILWENVTGAFSSNSGQDFRTVLEEIAETEIPMPKSGKWADAGMVRGAGRSIAWRVLDAQYWGVPQRRKRIFLVADFTGQSAPEILFESEGMLGHITESRKAREEVAAGVGDGVTGSIGIDALATNSSAPGRNVPHMLQPDAKAFRMVAFGEYADDDTASAMKARDYKDATDLVAVAPFNTGQITSPQNGNKVEFGLPCHTLSANEHPPSVIISYCPQGSMIGRSDKNGPQGDGINEDVAFTLNTTDRHAVAYPIQDQATRYAGKRGDKSDGKGNGLGIGAAGDPMFTLTQGDKHAVAYGIRTAQTSANGHGIAEDKAHTLDGAQGQAVPQLYENHSQDTRYKGPLDVAQPVTATYGMGGNNQPFVVNPAAYTVRRLTPTECELLQGFPLGWTDIPGASDTGRYKALGNSVAVPCVAWIIGRIEEATQC